MGYSEKFRLEIIQSAIRGYENQCEAADRGIEGGIKLQEDFRLLRDGRKELYQRLLGTDQMTLLVLWQLLLMEFWPRQSKLLLVRRQQELVSL